MTIKELEAVWRTAYEAEDRNPNERTIRAEADAWAAYTEACHKINQCLSPGCRTESLHHSYCPAHRD